MICTIAELLKVGMYREDTEGTFCSVLRMNHSDSQLRNEEQYNSDIKVVKAQLKHCATRYPRLERRAW